MKKTLFTIFVACTTLTKSTYANLSNSTGVIGYRCNAGIHATDWLGTAFIVNRSANNDITVATAAHVYNAIRSAIHDTCGPGNGRIFFISKGRYNQNTPGIPGVRNALNNNNAMIFKDVATHIRKINNNGNITDWGPAGLGALNTDLGRDVVFIKFHAPDIAGYANLRSWTPHNGGNSVHGSLITATGTNRAVCRTHNYVPCMVGYPGSINPAAPNNPQHSDGSLKYISWCRASNDNNLSSAGNNGLDRRILNCGRHIEKKPGDTTLIASNQTNLLPGASGGPHFCAKMNDLRITEYHRIFGVHASSNNHNNRLNASKIFRTDL